MQLQSFAYVRLSLKIQDVVASQLKAMWLSTQSIRLPPPMQRGGPRALPGQPLRPLLTHLQLWAMRATRT